MEDSNVQSNDDSEENKEEYKLTDIYSEDFGK